jgi:NAD(P)-dependent dehydrogenase (short-subunit alcohol dehydrogenase family)
MRIRDSVELVTGTNRGFGLVFAQELLAVGARKGYAAARHLEHITLDGVDRLDVTKPESIAAAAREHTDVNLLIYNAGVNFWREFDSRDAVEAARSDRADDRSTAFDNAR